MSTLSATETIDQALTRAMAGDWVLQHISGNRCTYLIYLFDEFWMETYEAGELVNVECVDRNIAAFSLTARYSQGV